MTPDQFEEVQAAKQPVAEGEEKSLFLNIAVQPGYKEFRGKFDEMEELVAVLQTPVLRRFIEYKLALLVEQRMQMQFIGTQQQLHELHLQDAYKRGMFDELTDLYTTGA